MALLMGCLMPGCEAFLGEGVPRRGLSLPCLVPNDHSKVALLVWACVFNTEDVGVCL